MTRSRPTRLTRPLSPGASGALKTSTSRQPSALGRALTRTIGRRAASLTSVQEIAGAHVLATVDDKDVAALAALGGGGKWKQNIERDMNRKMTKLYDIQLVPFMQKTRCKKPDGKFEELDVAIVLPHELLGELSRVFPVDVAWKLFGTPSEREQYWKAQEAAGEEWFQRHPLHQMCVGSSSGKCIPIRIWGDDAPMGKHGRCVRSACWSSVTNKSADHASKFLIWALDPKVISVPDEEPLWSVVAWSINAMATGRYPLCGPDGTPFLSGPRAKLAGRPLTTEFAIGVFAQFGADWKFLNEELHFEQSQAHEYVCRFCFAQKSAGAHNYSDASDNPGWLGTRRTQLEHQQSLERRNLQPAIMTMIGWHFECVVDDFMHDNCLGVQLHHNGSTLVVLARAGVFGPPGAGPWQERLDRQLACGFARFRNYCRDHNLSHSHCGFSHLGLTMHTLTDWPVLKSKAHNSAMVGLWLAHETAETQRASEYMSKLAACSYGFAALWCIVSAAGMILTEGEANKLASARRQALMGYQWLAHEAAAREEYLFEFVPKFHKLDESLRRSSRTRVNPAWHWCFSEESWVGFIARLANSTHKVSLQRRTALRWLLHMYGEWREMIPE